MGLNKSNHMNKKLKFNLDAADIFFALWCASVLIFLLTRPQPKEQPAPAPKQEVKEISNVVQIDRGEAEVLARLIESEASGESEEGCIAVANVVINTAKLNNTTIITEIFTEGRYNGVKTKSFYRVPSEKSRKAALLALTGTNILPEHFTFFLNEKTAKNKKMLQMARTNQSIKIDNHVFFSYFRDL
jgi:N-acetylmuramoyl-L-alanine amidase